MKQDQMRSGLWLMVGTAAVLAAAGFCVSRSYGLAVLITGAILCMLHAGLEAIHRRKMRQLNDDLDDLLQRGTPLPIDQYQEGELSILANQMEKVTLRLTESADRIQKEKEYLSDSLADISHQLRTPMTAMNLAVTMLRNPDLDARKRMELTAELRSQLQRIDWLVETLLKISKLDAGTVTMEKNTVAVRDLIARAVSHLAIPMDIRDQKLEISCEDETFQGDLTWMAEALGNILKNCMEHTPSGGTISVTAEETALYTSITVEDTGPGFAPKDLPHLFERFYQGSNASANSYGIGLSLARSVITAHNGTVQAMNGSHGAKFVLKFYKQVI